MGKNYGLPYMGSKNKIAEWVVAHIPQADTLVDLFAGGCAVTERLYGWNVPSRPKYFQFSLF